LIDQLASVDQTVETDAFFPGGVVKHHTPARRTVRNLLGS
jgi:hypothetical protein